MGAQLTKQQLAQKPEIESIVLKRTSSYFHNLNSARDLHKQYIWKKWKFCDKDKCQLLLNKLHFKMNNPQNYLISVLDVQFTKTNVQNYKVRAKIQFSERNLKKQIERRKPQFLYYSLQQLWDIIRQICQIANFLQKNFIQLPDNLSSYLIFGAKIKVKDHQLLPNIKQQKKMNNNINYILSRLIANIILLTNQSKEVNIMQINRINLKYNANLATFLYCIREPNTNISQMINLCQRLRQQISQFPPKISTYSLILNKNKSGISSQNALNLTQPQKQLLSIKKNQIQIKSQQLSQRAIKKCLSYQIIQKNFKRIQQIKPKQIKKFGLLNPKVTVRKQLQVKEQNKQNIINIQNTKNSLDKKTLANSLQIQIQDHHFPKRNKQFIKTSLTADSQVTTSKIFQLKNTQARNDAFIKMTGGSRCDLFSQDENQQLLQSIIQSQQSIIIKNNESPLMSIDQDMDLLSQDFFKFENSIPQIEKQEQPKSLIQFGYQRNSTIMQVTQQNQDSAQVNQMQHSIIKSMVMKNNCSSSHISQFELENQNQNQKFVIEEYEGGSRYEGYIVNGLRNGFGKLYYEDGGSYQGSWKNGEIEGFGKLFYQSGDLAYQGYWSRGQFHGEGKIVNQNPDQINGMFNYYDFSQIGVAWIWYEGNFEQDHKNGHGTLMLSNGQKFTGTWAKNNVQGEGEFLTLDNRRIRGIWNNNILAQIKQNLEDQNMNFQN